MRVLLILWAFCCIFGPAIPAQESDLLSRIREKMAGVLQRQPNYTCTETVERSRQLPGNRARIEDTLRLEVALVDGKEMFAWPGSKQFEDRELGDFVSTGMFGNGNFAIYARILFLSNVATFENRGTVQLGGRSVVRYDFRVLSSTSGHRLRVNKQEAVVGFHGSLYADLETLDLRRMEVFAEDIPPELGLLAAETSVDYGRFRIGEEEFLLPSESKLMMALPETVNRNWIRFSGCRRFAGESTLLFDDPVLDEVAATSVALAEVTVPAGLNLQLEIPDLDLMHGAVGDPVRAIVRADLKNRRQLLAPKGSVAHGRIVLLDRYPTYFALRIDFQDLEWPGGHARLKLSFDQAVMATRSVFRAQTGEVVILRQAGPRLSGILMFWRTEP